MSMAQNAGQRLEMALRARALAKNGAAERVAEVCMEVSSE